MEIVPEVAAGSPMGDFIALHKTNASAGSIEGVQAGAKEVRAHHKKGPSREQAQVPGPPRRQG